MATNASGLPGLREWLGGDDRSWPALDGLDDGDRVVACYYLSVVKSLRTRRDTPYLKLELCDRHGIADGRVWDDAETVANRVDAGTYVGVRGTVQVYRGDRQLKVEAISPIQVVDDELGLFLPRAPREQEAMERELDDLIDSVEDAPLRELLRRLLGRESAIGRRFRFAPAAKRNHHAYVGGLLEHTLSVATLCDRLAEHYGSVIDRDLLLAGALLHDSGKIKEIATAAGFPYTDDGKLLGHIVLGIQMVEDAAREVPGLSAERSRLVQHLVACHQGKYEWQSPREPRTLEGLLLHYADDMDAKLHQAARRVLEVEEGWTDYDRSFRRDFLRHDTRPDPAEPPAEASLDAPAEERRRTPDPPRSGEPATDAERMVAGGREADEPDPSVEADGGAEPTDDETLNLFGG